MKRATKEEAEPKGSGRRSGGEPRRIKAALVPFTKMAVYASVPLLRRPIIVALLNLVTVVFPRLVVEEP